MDNEFKRMQKLAGLLNEDKQTYDYGCVMLYFDFPEIEDIHSQIDKEDIYEEEGDRSYGLEDEPHCTLLYGLHEGIPEEEIKEKMDSCDFLECTVYNISLFKNEKYDVLKFDVLGDDLFEANEVLKQFPYTTDYPDYHPHLTIAYLKPGMGDKYVELFNDYKEVLIPQYIMYSKPNGDKVKIEIERDLFTEYHLIEIKQNWREYEINLNEGLIKTTDPGKSVNILKNKFPLLKFNYERLNNEFFININKGIKLDENELLVLLNNLGWFPSHVSITLLKMNNGNKTKIKINEKYNEINLKTLILRDDFISLSIRCEAKYDIKHPNIPKYLYHTTPEQNLKSIEQEGLIPKSRNKSSSHPERIYLTLSIETAEKLIPQLSAISKLNEYVILQINAEDINYLELYKDPNHPQAYYTLNSIPPYKISLVKTIKL